MTDPPAFDLTFHHDRAGVYEVYADTIHLGSLKLARPGVWYLTFDHQYIGHGAKGAMKKLAREKAPAAYLRSVYGQGNRS